jgi:hypothetical protein
MRCITYVQNVKGQEPQNLDVAAPTVMDVDMYSQGKAKLTPVPKRDGEV